MSDVGRTPAFSPGAACDPPVAFLPRAAEMPLSQCSAANIADPAQKRIKIVRKRYLPV